MKMIMYRALFLFSVAVLLFEAGHAQIVTQYRQFREREKYTTLFAGASIPVGTFSETYSDGAAKLGFSAGLDYMFPMGEEYEAGIIAAYNYQPFQKENLQYRYGVEDVRAGGWSLVWGLTAFGFAYDYDEEDAFYGRGMLGFLIGTSPVLEAQADGWRTTEGSSSSVSLAYGMGFGFQLQKNYEIGLRIMSGSPEYEVEGVYQGMEGKRKYEQTATTVQIVFGIRLK